MFMQTQAEETSLIARAINDGSSFAKLYNDYYPRVYNYVHYRIDDYHTANDLTSQIFEKLFSRLKSYAPEKSIFSAWLFSIARNTITDYYRSQARMRTRFASIETSSELIDAEPNPADIAALNETQQHLRKALASLNKRERDIIALKFWSGISNRDIAKLIGISESNIGVILFRSMRRLRVILERQGFSIYG
ncbi:RNA polymerase RpoE-like sigma-24 subunit [Anaerobacterium chartisolvens]|uniref:RNA polymerase RpoE-like sigma-24 subunit n=1 Tax=Anaerobacterium chartisolvens TaxID=1297424 RepID=A0A369BCT5_9FIRM|nr:sigma-70 family RNA polymerase sigma factor [Anaerobacterium chartisolvens]RCX19343.1 RNA polymerase RpoE-like sigma-24 subunit [Anaerobacterium chartisolvens]